MGAKNTISEITPEQVEQLQGKDNIVMIDVREAEEYRAGHIPEAKPIPLGELRSQIDQLDKSKEYIMICRSGNRSGLATDWLQSAGLQAKNMIGGMIAWNGPVK